MRHRLKGRKLGRTASHRSATLRALATALLKHKKIKTTVAKAKETRRFVEPLITKAKDGSVHARRLVADEIKDRNVVKELFDEIVPKIGERPGGYTRVVKLGNRVGDAAEMAIIELVDYNEVAEKKPRKATKAKKETPKVEEAEVIEEIKDEKPAEVDAPVEEAESVEEPKEEAAAEATEEEVKAEAKEEDSADDKEEEKK